MGAIAFDKSGEVWGASSSVIYAMLREMERIAGPRQYLSAFIRAFDHGYNSFSLEEVSLADHEDFGGLVRCFVETGRWRKYTEDPSEQFELEVMLRRLEQLTGASLAVRRAKMRSCEGL